MSKLRFRLGLVTAILLGGLVALRIAARFSTPGQPFKFLSLYAKVLQLTRTNYVDPVDPAELETRAADGLLGGLDGESGRIEADWHPERKTPFGLLLRSTGGYTLVLAVAPGSPAEKAGFAAGDVIRRIEGESVFGKQLPAVRARIEAAAASGKPIDLLTGRDEEKKSLTLSGSPDFEWGGVETVPPAAAGDPVRLVLRNTRAADGAALLEALAAARAAHPEAKVLLDLRANPGADYPGAAAIAGRLGGKSFTLAGNPESEFGKAEILAFPAAESRIDGLLTDRSTTGAAEALAASLKASGVPQYGRPSAGLAGTQARVTLSDGRLLWLTVKAVALEGKPLTTDGVEPDHPAPAETEDLAAFAVRELRAPPASPPAVSAPAAGS